MEKVFLKKLNALKSSKSVNQLKFQANYLWTPISGVALLKLARDIEKETSGLKVRLLRFFESIFGNKKTKYTPAFFGRKEIELVSLEYQFEPPAAYRDDDTIKKYCDRQISSVDRIVNEVIQNENFNPADVVNNILSQKTSALRFVIKERWVMVLDCCYQQGDLRCASVIYLALLGSDAKKQKKIDNYSFLTVGMSDSARSTLAAISSEMSAYLIKNNNYSLQKLKSIPFERTDNMEHLEKYLWPKNNPDRKIILK